MAEAKGFEPLIPFQVRQFSRLEPSTTRPRFLRFMINQRWQLLESRRSYPVTKHPPIPHTGFHMRSTHIAQACTSLLALTLLAAAKPPTHWQLGPFTRPTQAPVIPPDKSSPFHDPLRPTPVHWEALHTFNPAAIVRDGKIFVL